MHRGRILGDVMRLIDPRFLVRVSFRRTDDVRFRSANTRVVDRRCHVPARSPTNHLPNTTGWREDLTSRLIRESREVGILGGPPGWKSL